MNSCINSIEYLVENKYLHQVMNLLICVEQIKVLQIYIEKNVY